MRTVWAAVIWALLAASAQAWTEPARGSQTRSDLMSAVRPLVEWQLGAPVQFVVNELRAEGDVAYWSLSPQRPGGAAIDLFSTPAYQRGALSYEELDGLRFHVLYQKSGTVWVAVQWSMGATDVWWAAPDYCAIWRPVTPEVCQGL
ncbi:hypothetical protein [Falsiruegeria mediterranea]|uniref:Uncharacterized protein n=1 Tax=Falsiruegeria mediterranea M17 TaxID=1200281 RepID=A0A2R8CCZ6_9RHOB|nr:hypothetical protein [Falsiruegeria mediterranea]SPJ30290.1 hypothetical protein TRM7615_03821 [Falsiruegeria mediterranea M17]